MEAQDAGQRILRGLPVINRRSGAKSEVEFDLDIQLLEPDRVQSLCRTTPPRAHESW